MLVPQLTAYVGFLNAWLDKSNVASATTSDLLPPAVGVLFGRFLSVIMRRLSPFQGATMRSRLGRSVFMRYLAFLVVSQLIIFKIHWRHH